MLEHLRTVYSELMNLWLENQAQAVKRVQKDYVGVFSNYVGLLKRNN